MNKCRLLKSMLPLVTGIVVTAAHAKLPPPPPADPDKVAAAKALAAQAAARDKALLEKYMDRAVARYRQEHDLAAATQKK
jgi:hypothetical protein